MLSRSFVFALAFFAASRVYAEEAKPKATGVVVDVTKDVLDHVTVDISQDKSVVEFTLHDGYGVEKVLDGDKEIKTFDLKEQAPKSVTKYLVDSKPYVLVTVEPALRLAFKKESDKWAEYDISEFHEKVWFKGCGAVDADLEKLSDEAVFTATAFGTGKKYTFSAAGKRVGKLVSGDKVLLKGEKEFFLELEVFVGGDKKFARVVYLYKKDGRIKEVFFEKGGKKSGVKGLFKKSGDSWVRVEVKTAATALHDMDSSFPSDYKVAYDGFSISGVFLAVAALAISTLLY